MAATSIDPRFLASHEEAPTRIMPLPCLDCLDAPRIRHFQAVDGDELAKAIEGFLRTPERAFLSVSYAINLRATLSQQAILVYSEQELPHA